MSDEQRIIQWIKEDPFRIEALQIASSLGLNDWCLAAGFVRNLVWDRMHAYKINTPLNDIDLIYFNPIEISKETDEEIEKQLRQMSEHPWSVKNQARMHKRNRDEPYTGTENAMSFWVEVETAVGARLELHHDITLVAPLGLQRLFNNTITLNPRRPKPEAFKARLESKRWLQQWPSLEVRDALHKSAVR